MNERDNAALDALIAEYHWYPGDAITMGFVSGLGQAAEEIKRLMAENKDVRTELMETRRISSMNTIDEIKRLRAENAAMIKEYRTELNRIAGVLDSDETETYEEAAYLMRKIAQTVLDRRKEPKP